MTELLQVLDDRDPDVRWLAVGLLGRQLELDAVIVAALADRLTDRHERWRVQVAAAEALRGPAGAGSRQAWHALAAAARDSALDWRARAAAIEALWDVDAGRSLGLWLRDVGESLVLLSFDGEIAFGPAGKPVAASVFRSRDPRALRLAIMALALAHPARRERLSTLAAALDSDHASVVARAREALRLGGETNQEVERSERGACDAGQRAPRPRKLAVIHEELPLSPLREREERHE